MDEAETRISAAISLALVNKTQHRLWVRVVFVSENMKILLFPTGNKLVQH